MNLFKRVAITAVAPMMLLGVAGGAIASFGGSTASANVPGPPPIHIPPPVVREFPAKAIPFGVVSCVKANAQETQELADLTRDLAVALNQANHTAGPLHAWFASDATEIAAQIAAIHITPCPVLYFCPKGTTLETVKVITPPATRGAKPTVTVLHECVIHPEGPPRI